MRMIGVLAAAVVLAATGAQGQGAPSCATYAKAVEDQLQLAALDDADTVTHSAAQATQVAAEQANRLSIAAMNLQLMIASRCPMPARAFSVEAYRSAALHCAVAEAAERDTACDRSKWKREP